MTNAEHAGKTIEVIDGIKVIDCDRCGYRHVHPFPTKEDFTKTYENDYYETVWPDYFKNFEQDKDWWFQCYNERYDVFESVLGPGRHQLLDVGSGPGFFLRVGGERGWNVLGIEPSKAASEYSRQFGFEVRREFFGPGTVDLPQCDAIHLSEVLEHIEDPKEMLGAALKHLRPGGVLSIIVPNDFSPFQRALVALGKQKPWWIAPHHHLNYFTIESLKQLVESLGMSVHHVTTTFPIDLFLMMDEDYVGNPSLGRQIHGRRKVLERNLANAGMNQLKLKWYNGMAELNLGREIILYAVKPT